MNNGVNFLSTVVHQLEVLAEETEATLGFATGFVCNYKGQLFFITNWHVVTGKNFITGEMLHESGASPGFLLIKLKVHKNRNKSSKESELIEWTIKYSLYENYIPDFILHPTLGQNVDVVALPLNVNLPETGIEVCSVDIENELRIVRTELQVMQTLFIIGYPLKSDTTPNAFPIYKHCTIASEPQYVSDVPFFYIDGKTKKGMSGSFVILKTDSPHFFVDPKTLKHAMKVEFIGIYSGRDRKEVEYEAELGIIWPFQECLLPILESFGPKTSDEKSNLLYFRYSEFQQNC